jgi:hypothetical protein
MFPQPARAPTSRLVDGAVYLVATAGLAFSIALLWLGMRAVMGVGGFCADGGPYVIETPCPPGAELMFLAFPLGFASAVTMIWKGSALGGLYAGLPWLAWPALFLSLGWNFLEFGLFGPGGEGVVLGWIVPGVVFMLMGGGPLLLVLRSGAPAGWGSSTGGSAPGFGGRASHRPANDDLARLQRLHAAGMLTSAEYEAARAAAGGEASQ